MRTPVLSLALLAGCAAVHAEPSPGGTVSGTVVAVKDGKAVVSDDVYVYLQPTRPVRGKLAGDGQSFAIHQKNRAFEPHVLVVPAGSVVWFPNDDAETHNVWSPNGPPAFFDLGRYQTDKKGPSRKLDVPGEVEIYCDIHKEMWAKIRVVDTMQIQHVENGKYTFTNVAPGSYRVVAWAPSTTDVKSPDKITVTAGQSVTAKELHLQLAPLHTTHMRKDGKPYCPDGYSDC